MTRDADVLLLLLDGDGLGVGAFAPMRRIEETLAGEMDFDGGGLVDVLVGEEFQVFVVQVGRPVHL